MSTAEPSKCCVCGEASDKRCGPCGKNGIDLFFCSPEHQKLIVVPMLLNPPPTFSNTHRYHLPSESRRLFLADGEGFIRKNLVDVAEHSIWAQVARFQLNAFARDLNMALDITPYMDLAGRMTHILLIMISLVRLRTTEPAAIPLAGVKRAFERFADLIAEVKPFQDARDGIEAMSWYLHHVSLLTRQPCRAERQAGTNKLVFRFVD